MILTFFKLDLFVCPLFLRVLVFFIVFAGNPIVFFRIRRYIKAEKIKDAHQKE